MIALERNISPPISGQCGTSKKGLTSGFISMINLTQRSYFEYERNQKKSQNLMKAVERTPAATGASRKNFSLIKTEADVENWEHPSGKPVQLKRGMDVPPKFCALRRHSVIEIPIENFSVGTVDSVLLKLQNMRVEDVEHLTFFEESEIPSADSIVWIYCRPIPYRFMKFIGLFTEKGLLTMIIRKAGQILRVCVIITLTGYRSIELWDNEFTSKMRLRFQKHGLLKTVESRSISLF